MKYSFLFLLLILSTQFIFSQNYSIEPEVISSGGGEITGGSFINFAVIGEVIVNKLASNGDHETKIGFIYAAEEFPLNPTANISLAISGNNIEISWDSVTGASSYSIYSSSNPYLSYDGWTLEESGITDTNWCDAADVKKFYYVKACN